MISVAIDGPAGAGKSTLARRLASDLGYIYVDTGAMYRTIGLYALRAGKDPKDNEAVNTLLPEIELHFAFIDGEQHIYLGGEDVSSLIRTEEVGMAASAVGANPAVRAFLLDMQRDMARKQDVLMDGRDIGTVVLPDATVKIFLTASPEARATRRWKEYQAKGMPNTYEEVLEDVKQRDYQDTHRAAAPLKQAEDAVLLDTSELNFEQSLEAMKQIIARKVGGGDGMVLYYILLPLAWLVFHIGFRVRAEGRENLKKVQTRGYILAPNHISAIDPVFVIITRFWGRRMIVFAKKELFEINAFLSWFFRCAGAMCVRGTKEEAAVIDETVARCQNGESLLIFPEGTREKDGTFLQPKSGLFVIAAAAAVDVVPVRIHYETPDGKMKLFCKVRVVYGEPMPAARFAMESRRDMKKLRANKQALLDAWEKL